MVNAVVKVAVSNVMDIVDSLVVDIMENEARVGIVVSIIANLGVNSVVGNFVVNNVDIVVVNDGDHVAMNPSVSLVGGKMENTGHLQVNNTPRRQCETEVGKSTMLEIAKSCRRSVHVGRVQKGHPIQKDNNVRSGRVAIGPQCYWLILEIMIT